MALPLIFYMLQEFRVPRCMHFIAVHPIDNKFRKYRVGEVLGYARELKRFIHGCIGCPAWVETLRNGTVLKTILMSSPALSSKLNKLTVYVFRGAASFFPVKDELWANRFYEL